MSRPFITVVIPVLNRACQVERALNSVFNQDFRPLRLIVVDNNSTDNTVPVVEGWIRAHKDSGFEATLLHESHPGAAAARNRGLSEADSEWVMFLDSDDEMLPGLLTSAMNVAGPDTDLIAWNGIIDNGNGKFSLKSRSRQNPLRRHIFNSLLFTISYAVRTELIRHCGGWDNTLNCWDDWELGLRLLAFPDGRGGMTTPVIKFIDTPLVLIHIQDESITGTSFSSKAGEWEKAIEAMETHTRSLPSPIREKILWMMAYRRVNLAALYAREGNRNSAETLMKSVLSGDYALPLSFGRRLLLKGIYHYTRLGGRAAYILIR